MHFLTGCLLIVISPLASPEATVWPDDKQTEKQKRIAEQAKKFEYSGTRPFMDYNIGTAYQSVASTADDLSKVDAWYKKRLEIQPGEGTGVSSRTVILNRDTAKERGVEVRRVLYSNDRQARDADPRQTVPQTPTVRSYVLKNEGYTVVIVAARSVDGKATQISVSLLPDAAE